MKDEEINAKFTSIVESSFAEEEIPNMQMELDIISLTRAIARLNELSTFLGRYVLATLTLGPDVMAPLGEEITFGISEMEKMAKTVLEDLMEFADECDCPDCVCECDELSDELICDSCIRVEDCECGLDGTCSVCIEYEIKHPD